MESSCSVIQTPCNMAVESDHGGGEGSGWTRRVALLPGSAQTHLLLAERDAWGFYAAEAPP